MSDGSPLPGKTGTRQLACPCGVCRPSLTRPFLVAGAPRGGLRAGKWSVQEGQSWSAGPCSVASLLTTRFHPSTWSREESCRRWACTATVHLGWHSCPVLWRKKPGQGGRDEQQSQDPNQAGPGAAGPGPRALPLLRLRWHGTRRTVGLLEVHGPGSWNTWSKFRRVTVVTLDDISPAEETRARGPSPPSSCPQPLAATLLLPILHGGPL